MTYRTRDGREVVVTDTNVPGMSVFCVAGEMNGVPCHWTKDGHYRMDGIEDPRDIMDFTSGR